MNIFIIYLIWLLIGGLCIWFSHNWLDGFDYERDGVIGASIFTFVFAGIIWPVFILAVWWPTLELKNRHPLKTLNKPMKYFVNELKNPRKNV